MLAAGTARASAQPLPTGSPSQPAGTTDTAAPEASPPSTSALEFTPFNDQLFLHAKKSGEPVVLYFEADWCAPCKEMHARTFRAPAVLEAAAGKRFFRVDMTTPSHYLALVQKSFHVTGAPTVIVFGTDGKEATRRFGFIPPEDFVRLLDEGLRPGKSS